MSIVYLPVPVFKFESEQLDLFRQFHGFVQTVHPEVQIHPLWSNEYQNPVMSFDRLVWSRSHIGYIVNYGLHSTLWLSIAHYQHSRALREWSN